MAGFSLTGSESLKTGFLAMKPNKLSQHILASFTKKSCELVQLFSVDIQQISDLFVMSIYKNKLPEVPCVHLDVTLHADNNSTTYSLVNLKIYH